LRSEHADSDIDDSRLLQHVGESTWGPADVESQCVVWELRPWQRAWKKAGLEQSSTTLEEFAEAVAQEGLTRRLVRGFGKDPERLLIAAMAWGFGTTGYGGFRAATMLGHLETIEAIVATARSGTAEEAYRRLWDRHRTAVPYLGTAFGTKLLYFAGNRGTRRPRPLIYDANVWRGLRAMGHDFPPPASVTTPRYIAYLELVERVAKRVQVSPDVVEYTLFCTGKQERRLRRASRSRRRHTLS
jgi:hypothetical protein